jgi:hypothetical protein
MPHDHSHAHPKGPHAHAPRPRLRPSLLRVSAAQRISGAGAILALLWLAVHWALA